MDFDLKKAVSTGAYFAIVAFMGFLPVCYLNFMLPVNVMHRVSIDGGSRYNNSKRDYEPTPVSLELHSDYGKEIKVNNR